MQKIYHFWNGKNIDGKSTIGLESLLREESRTAPAEMKYEVGVETIAADDLQKGVDYS
ncbi:Hypothetical protein LUCI_4029 [Lucifera butyrica]|uniref:Uncharacterized protein n=1 Tax=Lucifera butyrica TaxID=1351585 RepID=A0A498RD12_9FIRM|nr:hypothetical protein [Lucifera butyrica]VBB08750.1 Hypothetical protein LUCI_4029 [Lucifera butyrica]